MNDWRATAARERPVTAASRRLPWSLLRTEWLHIPVSPDAGRASPTWGVFAERFERCLRSVSSYVSQRVNDRERLERVVTEVVAENLHLLVAQLDAREELACLMAAADRLIVQRAVPDPRRSRRGDHRVGPSAREPDLAVPDGSL